MENNIYFINDYYHMPSKSNTEKFIEKAQKIHGDRYDYSESNYINSETPVCIICPEHGRFWQTPHQHLRGGNCPSCGKRAQLNNETFIKRAQQVHGNKYDYSQVDYKGNNEKICVICPKHGEFWQQARAHLAGEGCPRCGDESVSRIRRKAQNDFIAQANILHKNKYNYDKVNYVNAITPVTITCPLHGDFQQTPHKHLSNHGCPICGSKNNLTEIKTFNILKENFKNVEYQKVFPFLREGSGVQKIDFFIPEYNVGIELNGRQYYMAIDAWGGEEEYNKIQKRDIIKYKKCSQNGIKILYYFPEIIKKYVTNYFSYVYTSLDELITNIKNNKI